VWMVARAAFASHPALRRPLAYAEAPVAAAAAAVPARPGLTAAAASPWARQCAGVSHLAVQGPAAAQLALAAAAPDPPADRQRLQQPVLAAAAVQGQNPPAAAGGAALDGQSAPAKWGAQAVAAAAAGTASCAEHAQGSHTQVQAWGVCLARPLAWTCMGQRAQGAAHADAQAAPWVDVLA
jgi:hypothetical protein